MFAEYGCLSAGLKQWQSAPFNDGSTAWSSSLKNIKTLPKDIYALFDSDFKFSEEQVAIFGKRLSQIISERTEERKFEPTLRMSNLGAQCLRKLWYQLNTPELSEKLDGKTRLKFLYGDIIEALVLFLAEAAGHEVVGTQDELEINGVKGHRDAIIDGVLVDVKSASSFGFKKFEGHQLEGTDPFGYLDQINAYLFASKDDPRIADKKHAAFVAVDKSLGDVVVDIYEENGVDYHAKIDEIRLAMVQPDPPPRAYNDIPDGKSGNRKLGVECSYCGFRDTCWPNLRTFVYSTGPRHFTHIEKEPRVEAAGEF
jgi:hypothetical protein